MRMKKLEEKGCALDKLDRVMEWEQFRSVLEKVFEGESLADDVPDKLRFRQWGGDFDLLSEAGKGCGAQNADCGKRKKFKVAIF